MNQAVEDLSAVAYELGAERMRLAIAKEFHRLGRLSDTQFVLRVPIPERNRKDAR